MTTTTTFRRVALGVVGTMVTAGGLTTMAGPAQAASATTVKSSDGGGRASITFSWKNQAKFTITGTNCDIKKDGDAPNVNVTLFYSILTGSGANRVVWANTNGKGNGNCVSSGTQTGDTGGARIDYVEVTECNGSNWLGRTNCATTRVSNPK